MEFQNSYLDLGEGFYQTADPEPVRSPELFLWNHGLAQSLNIAAVNDAGESARAQFFSGNAKLPGARPIALAYAGHQFGHFNPQLGDGRAHLLGDVSDGTCPGQDIQLKGSGKTAFSRGGDGRCALGPAIREFVMSEAMAALGVPTTRCLAVVTTGETVYRETPLPGAVVTRVAASHLRVGSFEYFAARNQYDSVQKLCDYAIRKHYPGLNDLEGAERYLAFLAAAVEKQVRLVCEWMRVGFIHGVMNTDNTAISGETIDFGPCAMMGAYSPNTVFSSIDTQGRYRFGHQPNIAQWNLARLAETLIPLVDDDANRAIEKITPIVMAYTDQFQKAYWNMIAQKYGLRECTEDDIALLTEGLDVLKAKGMDYTNTFDLLTRSFESVAIASEMKSEIGPWYMKWQDRLAQETDEGAQIAERMRKHNPVVIPRNHHMEQVIAECIESGSPEAALRFLAVLRDPYQVLPETKAYQDIPGDGDRYYQTFCGT